MSLWKYIFCIKICSEFYFQITFLSVVSNFVGQITLFSCWSSCIIWTSVAFVLGYGHTTHLQNHYMCNDNSNFPCKCGFWRRFLLQKQSKFAKQPKNHVRRVAWQSSNFFSSNYFYNKEITNFISNFKFHQSSRFFVRVVCAMVHN